MIITDGTHLVSTVSADELHEFAKRIGLHREWYQDKGKDTGLPSKHPHYDLMSKRRKIEARLAGAQLVTSHDLLRMAWWSPYKARQVKP